MAPSEAVGCSPTHSVYVIFLVLLLFNLLLQFNFVSNIMGFSSTKQYVVKKMQKEGWPNNSTFFCSEWDTNLDAWWTHQPEWEASYENDTHYCFSHIHDTEKA
jgi:hypothetical protein